MKTQKEILTRNGDNMAKSSSTQTRCSKKFKREVINYIKAKYYLAGRKPPTNRQILDMIIDDKRMIRIIKNEFSPQ